MALKPAKFKLDEEVSLSGRPMRVAGLLQLEGAGDQVVTRYLLAEAAGAPQILEESGERLGLLRPFPAAAHPVAAGNTVTVMGEKYTLAGVRKFKVLGAAGQPPGGQPKAALLLSGVFEGPMGSLVREMAPGAGAQTFYSLKPVPAEEVLNGAQLAEKQEADRRVAQLKAESEGDDEEDDAKGWPIQKAVSWIVTVVVVVLLGYACSGSDDDGSSGSVRGSFHVGGGHGGK